MRLIFFVDLHSNPGDFFSLNLRDYPGKVIAGGDTFNIIPWGMDAWRTDAGQFTIDSFMASVPNDVIIFYINHEGDRIEWLKELFKNYPNVEICRGYNYTTEDRLYLFRHGSDYSDWRLWKIGADDVTVFMTRWNGLKRLWYWYCQQRGWIPAEGVVREITLKPHGGLWTPKKRKNQEKYNKWHGLMCEWALDEAHGQPMPTHLYMGHTHTPRHVDTMDGYKIINLGNEEVIEVR